MAIITSNIRKSITLNNEIKVDDIVVKGQQATIDSTTQNITFSDWINNMELYKENRKISSENVRYAGEMIKSTARTVVNYGISTTTSPAVKSAFKAKREKGLRLVFMNGEINWIY